MLYRHADVSWCRPLVSYLSLSLSADNTCLSVTKIRHIAQVTCPALLQRGTRSKGRWRHTHTHTTHMQMHTHTGTLTPVISHCFIVSSIGQTAQLGTAWIGEFYWTFSCNELYLTVFNKGYSMYNQTAVKDGLSANKWDWLHSLTHCDWTLIRLSWWRSMCMVTSHATRTNHSCCSMINNMQYMNVLHDLSSFCTQDHRVVGGPFERNR